MWEGRMARIVPHEDLYDRNTTNHYMAWFNREGMRTIYWQASTAQSINFRRTRTNTGVPTFHSFTIRAEAVQQTLVRNLLHAREAIGALRTRITGQARAFARRTLRVCRGNIEDVNQGAVFQQFLEQHGVDEGEFELTEEERPLHPDPTDYNWLSTLVGGDYAGHIPEPPIYHPHTLQLSQAGVWHHGESSSAAGIRMQDRAESSSAAEVRVSGESSGAAQAGEWVDGVWAEGVVYGEAQQGEWGEWEQHEAYDDVQREEVEHSDHRPTYGDRTIPRRGSRPRRGRIPFSPADFDGRRVRGRGGS